jgi:hypothetical protein
MEHAFDLVNFLTPPPPQTVVCVPAFDIGFLVVAQSTSTLFQDIRHITKYFIKTQTSIPLIDLN